MKTKEFDCVEMKRKAAEVLYKKVVIILNPISNGIWNI